jgi:hypothetical protein
MVAVDHEAHAARLPHDQRLGRRADRPLARDLRNQVVFPTRIHEFEHEPA